jgi:predicted permease
MLVRKQLKQHQRWLRQPLLSHLMAGAITHALGVSTPSQVPQALPLWSWAVHLPLLVLTVVEVGLVVQKVRELEQRPQLAE